MFGKSRYMALKLDMSSVYDHVIWKSLAEVMRKMGYEQRWIDLVNCVNIISYSILISGKTQLSFHPLEVLDKRTPHHHIFSSYVLKLLLFFSTK